MKRSFLHPSKSNLILLKIVLDSSTDSISLWEEWNYNHNINHISVKAAKFLPAIYHRLEECGYTGKDMGMLRGTYRRCIYRNHLLLRQAAVAVKILEEQNIPTMMMKGSVMVVDYYKDFGLRPLVDVDLMVRPEDRYKAAHYLSKAGWKPSIDPKGGVMEYSHSLPFIDRERNLDMHWLLFDRAHSNASVDEIWEKAEPFSFTELETKRNSATHLLFSICMNSSEILDRDSFWLLDASKIISIDSEKIDWDCLVSLAISHQVIGKTIRACQLLVKHCDSIIPENVIATLCSQPISNLELDEENFLARNGRSEWLRKLRIDIYRFERSLNMFSRRSFAKDGFSRSFALMDYLRRSFGIRQARWLPFYLLYKAVGILVCKIRPNIKAETDL